MEFKALQPPRPGGSACKRCMNEEVNKVIRINKDMNRTQQALCKSDTQKNFCRASHNSVTVIEGAGRQNSEH